MALRPLSPETARTRLPRGGPTFTIDEFLDLLGDDLPEDNVDDAQLASLFPSEAEVAAIMTEDDLAAILPEEFDLDNTMFFHTETIPAGAQVVTARSPPPRRRRKKSPKKKSPKKKSPKKKSPQNLKVRNFR